ncbi:MAG: SLBB domain-containing protein [Chlorobiaceae bacterium]
MKNFSNPNYPVMKLIKIIMIMMLSIQCIIISTVNMKVMAAPNITPSAFGSLFSQEQSPPTRNDYNPLSGPNYPMRQDAYFTDDRGNILMIVNVLGEVNRPGQLVVRENADFPTILSLVGGWKETANLKKVLVARLDPDNKAVQAYRIDIKQYCENGDRASFIALKPNDTIIIPKSNGISLSDLSQIAGLIYTGFTGYSVIHNHM